MIPHCQHPADRSTTKIKLPCEAKEIARVLYGLKGNTVGLGKLCSRKEHVFVQNIV